MRTRKTGTAKTQGHEDRDTPSEESPREEKPMRHRDIPPAPALVGGEWWAKLEGASAQTWPNIPVERTAHSVGFFPMRGSVGCGPPLTGGVRCLTKISGRRPKGVV